MGTAMEANKSQTFRNKRKRKRIVLESQVPGSDVVDITLKEEECDDDARNKGKRKIIDKKQNSQKDKASGRNGPTKRKVKERANR